MALRPALVEEQRRLSSVLHTLSWAARLSCLPDTRRELRAACARVRRTMRVNATVIAAPYRPTSWDRV